TRSGSRRDLVLSLSAMDPRNSERDILLWQGRKRMRNWSFTRRETLTAIGGFLLSRIPLAASAAEHPSVDAGNRSTSLPLTSKSAAGYDAERLSMTGNKRVADLRKPDAIVAATSANDVAAAIRFARANKMKVTARGSSHNFSGAFLREGCLLIDLSR